MNTDVRLISRMRKLFRAGSSWLLRVMLPAVLLLLAGASPARSEKPSNSPISLQWTADERVWLDTHPVVTFGVNDFPPLIFSARDGHPVGIGVEYVSLIASRIGVTVKWITYPSWDAEVDALRHGGLDVAPTMANGQTPAGLLAGQEWMFLQGVIITRHGAPKVTGIEDFAGQVVAAQGITPGEMEIRRRFPHQKLLVTQSVPEMFDAVVDGKAAAGVGMLAIIDYEMRNRGYGNSLELAAPFGEHDVPVRMLVGAGDRVLIGILDKAITTVADEERQQILQRWFVPSIAGGLDSSRVTSLALTVALPTVALVTFVLYWVLRLRREVRWRKEAQLQAQQQTVRLTERTTEVQQERAAAEAARRRIADITDSLPGIVFEFIRAPDGAYSASFVSGAMEELVGLTREAVVEDVGRYFARVLPEDLDGYLDAIERSAASGGEVRHSFRIRHAGSGEIRWLAARTFAPRRENGSSNWRGYVVDITEQKRLESDLEQALERAKAAERAKGESLANMSHEIRTPMNAIIGMSYLVLQTELSVRQLNYVTKIDTAAKSLLSIINDALDFSKIEAGKLTLESAPFTLQAVLDNLTTLIGQRAQQKGLELLFDIAPAIPAVLLGDATRLGQILVNLCSNAVKFTETGEIIVGARLLETAGIQNLIRFAVQDSGIGVPPDQIGRLFRPFEQADASITRKYGGTGLGLTIAKRLSEMMGGEIGVQSEPGHGSTFWFTVRLPAGQRSGVQPTTVIDGIRMLIVDDNATARAVLLSIATSLKLNAAAVASGEEAVSALQAAEPPYDIVLTDWKMPGMSGAALVRTIMQDLKLKRTPRVIIATAYDSEELLQELAGVRIDDLLIKPMSASTLLDAVQRVLGSDGGMPGRLERVVAAATVPDLRGLRILLTEDNDVNREVAEEIIAQTGAEIVSAVNGEEAVKVATSEHVDAVLMDIQMPVMDGETATRALRSNPALRELPIIAMTASALVGDRERYLAAGMNDHVVKPIQVSELFAALTRWLRPGDITSADVNTAQHERTSTAFAPEVTSTRPVVAPTIPPIEGLNVAEGLARVNGNVGFYLRILRKFRENQAGVIKRIRVALECGDRQSAMREAHTVVGAGGNIGANTLCEAARAVESCCATGSPVTEMRLQVMEALLGALFASLDPVLEEDRRVAPEGIPDRSRVISLLCQLRHYIDESDGTAVDTLEALRLVLGDDSRIVEIERYLGRYDFAAAGSMLDVLARDFDPPSALLEAQRR